MLRGFHVVHHMDPGERLDADRTAMAEGRFADALREYQWFHDKALEVDASYYGVRLSYALSDWVDLGKKCPPALDALCAVRDRKTAELAAGKGTRELFHDVSSINEALDEPARTHSLFRLLADMDPELAQCCGSIAMPCRVTVGAFELAARSG